MEEHVAPRSALGFLGISGGVANGVVSCFFLSMTLEKRLASNGQRRQMTRKKEEKKINIRKHMEMENILFRH